LKEGERISTKGKRVFERNRVLKEGKKISREGRKVFDGSGKGKSISYPGDCAQGLGRLRPLFR
jgi:hypothetical protein